MTKQVLELILQKFKEDKLTMDEVVMLIQSYSITYPLTYIPSVYETLKPGKVTCTPETTITTSDGIITTKIK